MIITKAVVGMLGCGIGAAVGMSLGYTAGVKSSQRFMRTMIHTGVMALGAEWPRPSSLTALNNKAVLKAKRSKLILP